MRQTGEYYKNLAKNKVGSLRDLPLNYQLYFLISLDHLVLLLLCLSIHRPMVWLSILFLANNPLAIVPVSFEYLALRLLLFSHRRDQLPTTAIPPNKTIPEVKTINAFNHNGIITFSSPIFCIQENKRIPISTLYNS